MRKRIAAALAALLFVLSAAPLPSRAAQFMCFTAVNDDLLALSADTLPAYFGTTLYVAGSIFTRYLGLNAGYNRSSSVYYVYKNNVRLNFNMQYNTVTDEKGNSYAEKPAEFIGNVVFLPLDFICEHFGFKTSLIPSDSASVLRITDKSAVLNDNTFISLKKDEMRAAYNEYYGITPAPVTPETAPAPSSGQIEPAPAEITPETPVVTYENVTLYLSFYSLDAEAARDIIGVLNSYAVRGSFYMSETEIFNNPSLAREIAGYGHSVCIWLEDGSYEEYERASRLLFEAAKIKTPIIASGSGARDKARETADEHNLIYRADSTAYDTARPSNRLPTASGSAAELRVQCTAPQANSMRQALQTLRDKKYTIKAITETSPAL